jgi:hypothetical protein
MNIRQRIFRSAASGDSPVVTAKKPKGARADMLHSIAVRREESRRGDTRLADRYFIAGESARVTHAGSTYDARLTNICGSGAMVSGDFEPLPWDRVELHLGDDRPIDCKVLWIRDGRVGLEFASEIRLDRAEDAHAGRLREVISRHFPDVKFDAPAQPQPEPEAIEEDDKRAEHRRALIRRGMLHYDYQSTTARLRDISTTGVMLETELALAPGAEPLIDLAEAGSVFGTVVWTDGSRAGLRFKQPFDCTQLFKRAAEPEAPRWEAPAYLRNNSHCRDEDWDSAKLKDLGEDLDGFLNR